MFAIYKLLLTGLSSINEIFFKSSDDSMVSFLIHLYSMCRDKTSSIANGCKAAIELSKCFRAAIQQIGWVPDTTSLLVISYD